MVDLGDEPSFLRDIHILSGWYLQFHNIYDHENWKVGTSRKVDSLETYQAATGDAIMLRLCDFKKLSALPLNTGYGHHIETAINLRLIGKVIRRH